MVIFVFYALSKKWGIVGVKKSESGFAVKNIVYNKCNLKLLETRA